MANLIADPSTHIQQSFMQNNHVKSNSVNSKFKDENWVINPEFMDSLHLIFFIASNF